jgi:hypothetical protein
VPDNVYNQNKFEMIFDEYFDGVVLKQLFNMEVAMIEGTSCILTSDLSEDDMCDDD